MASITKKDISKEIDNLSSSKLSKEEKEFKKAFNKHFMGIASNVDKTTMLGRDYDRISRIQQQYPVMEFMNLFGRFDSMQKIDIDKILS